MLPPGAINEGEPVTPRPSATVLLVRGREPWELLLMQRPGGADFAPGAYVFPGGTVHADDMGWGDEIRMAAVREVFEEVGILLARRGSRFAREPDCNRTRSIVVALMGGALPTGLATIATSTITLFVPGLNLMGLAISSVTSGAYARSIGQLFIEHFENGASLDLRSIVMR